MPSMPAASWSPTELWRAKSEALEFDALEIEALGDAWPTLAWPQRERTDMRVAREAEKLEQAPFGVVAQIRLDHHGA